MSTSPAPSASDVMTVPVHHGMFCWFEHHSASPERAVEYWTSLVGGEHAAVPLPCGNTMHLMNAGQHHRWSLRALAGCPALLIERGPHWLPFVAVDDTDAAHARALELGACSVAAPHDNGMGRGAIIEDPQGGEDGRAGHDPITAERDLCGRCADDAGGGGQWLAHEGCRLLGHARERAPADLAEE